MRGGDDTGGDGRESRRLGLDVFAQIARAFAGDVTKGAAESAEAAPARVEGDFADRHLRVAQQRLGLLDAAREQVAMRRQAEGFLELPREMRRRQMAHPGQARHRPLFLGRGVHAVLGAQTAGRWVRSRAGK
jgi:hypothetical protein